MGDMGEVFNGMRGYRQQQHAKWKEANMAVLEQSGVAYRSTNYGETLLFRERDMPKADFYPSTGRWRVAGVTKTFRGGAGAFLGWYRKQRPRDLPIALKDDPVSCPVNDPELPGRRR